MASGPGIKRPSLNTVGNLNQTGRWMNSVGRRPTTLNGLSCPSVTPDDDCIEPTSEMPRHSVEPHLVRAGLSITELMKAAGKPGQHIIEVV